MKFKKGDKIYFTYDTPQHPMPNPPVIREILEAKNGYYLWCYPDLPKDESNIFDSRNSNDVRLKWWDYLENFKK